jgi:hypothetical protein
MMLAGLTFEGMRNERPNPSFLLSGTFAFTTILQPATVQVEWLYHAACTLFKHPITSFFCTNGWHGASFRCVATTFPIPSGFGREIQSADGNVMRSSSIRRILIHPG